MFQKDFEASKEYWSIEEKYYQLRELSLLFCSEYLIRGCFRISAFLQALPEVLTEIEERGILMILAFHLLKDCLVLLS